MGNCQTADAAAAVILHMDGRVERRHGAATANQIMGSNPGHCVAVVAAVRSKSTDGGKKPERYLRLLRPDENLLVGQVYKLVSFEDVLTVFGAKRRVRLSRLLAKQKEAADRGERGGESGSSADSSETVEEQQQGEASEGAWSTMRQGQWRPTLQTIAETGD